MLHIILHRPEIPQNTGNIGRLCAYTASRLHLIHPLGFSLSNKYLKRSGMDYWPSVDLKEHADWKAFKSDPDGPKRLWLFTTHAEIPFWNVTFEDGDGLVFGNEGHGAPPWLHDSIGKEHRLKIPQFQPDLRSLNLATSAAVAVYEGLRQINSRGVN